MDNEESSRIILLRLNRWAATLHQFNAMPEVLIGVRRDGESLEPVVCVAEDVYELDLAEMLEQSAAAIRRRASGANGER